MPRRGALCRLTGLGRTAIRDSIGGPDNPVRLISVRAAGAKRGVRLVRVHARFGWVESHAADVAAVAAPAGDEPAGFAQRIRGAEGRRDSPARNLTTVARRQVRRRGDLGGRRDS